MMPTNAGTMNTAASTQLCDEDQKNRAIEKNARALRRPSTDHLAFP
jgi:hypothetical protein